MPGSEIRTEVITFRGVVQGVGFRPTVYRIAQGLGMKGRVRNMGGIAQVVCTAKPEEIDAFVREIVSRKPPMARISGVERKIINTAVFHDFSIGQSSAEEDEIAVIPADIAVCEACLREFYDQDDPRYKHPFISCTNCGPRFSIIERLPYDRDTTTMEDFPMCGFCEGEYTEPASRRYHAQTISCHECGPQPQLAEAAKQSINEEVKRAAEMLAAGEVVAVKGVGGYYLACSPFDEEAVQRLREIKQREQKPFAVMFRDVGQIKEYCVVNPQEEAALCSPQRPILLLEQRPDSNKARAVFADRPSETPAVSFTETPAVSFTETPAGSPFVSFTETPAETPARPVTVSCEKPLEVFKPLAPGVCKTSRFVGAFLPSFALQYLLLDAAGPLIMTSANISELPLLTKDEEMAEMAAREPRIAGVLLNKRRIAEGLDDSVARVVDGEVQLIRRAKGYVPMPVYVQAADALTKDVQIFAAGGHLKSALAISKGAYSYLSRHIGDLDSMESENTYAETYERMKAFFEIEPELAVCDLHPRYFPTRFSEGLGLPVIRAQHHHAHIASVVAEHGLVGPVIGVSFDGTGYGTDSAIWGGEILICESAAFERFSHLKYIDMIGGDTSMKDAWKTAVSFLASLEVTGDLSSGGEASSKASRKASAAVSFPNEFTIDTGPLVEYCLARETLNKVNAKGERASVLAAIKAGVNTVKSSSMGRLFDAACAMLGIHYENRYEGECAILLENAAQRALTKQRFSDKPTEQESLALYFHTEVAQTILEQCLKARDKKGVQRVCLSGGVFQNKILTEETLRLLRGDCFTVYYNIHVPPNDGGLALGQNYIGMQAY